MFSKLGSRIISFQKNTIREVFRTTQRTFADQIQKCWKCGHLRKNIQTLFCENCKIIQKPYEISNYFKIFNIPANYAVDLQTLQNSYRHMQTQLHPDKFAKKSDDEKTISVEYSSLVNDAYNTLTNPMARALHLLKLNNETIVESDKSTDNEFLMEIMELNEAVESATTEQDFRQLQNNNRAVLANIELELKELFEAKDVNAAKQLVIRMKYYHSVSTKIKEAMTNKGFFD